MHIIEIKATDKVEECWGLLEAHRNEVSLYKDLMVVKPDIATYKALEDKGMLSTLALYDVDRIVGYSVSMLTHSLHYADLLTFQNDMIYVMPEYRKKGWGIRLIQATEDKGREYGAKIIFFHGVPGTAFSELMPKIGYNTHNVMFSKAL